jgi:tRNA (guanine37-N1)-methyltransferase
VKRKMDIIGSKERAVAIIDSGGKRKAVAIMRNNKNVKAVLQKVSKREGKYRTRKYKLVGGRGCEVVHKEHGLRFLVDPRKMYFSPREGTERSRVAEQIKGNETIMVFFAGTGPLVIHCAKKAKNVIGIEINKKAVEYFKENVKLNKLTNVEIVLGDVKEKAKLYYGKCDRVLMPLPESAGCYIEEAFACLKKNGICHFYTFASEGELQGKKKLLRKYGRIVGTRKVMQWGPGIWKWRIDVLKN